jgi:hypothetical protein
MRFKAIDLMTRMYTHYKTKWDSLKTELAAFILDCKSKGLTDEVSIGLIENLEA